MKKRCHPKGPKPISTREDRRSRIVSKSAPQKGFANILSEETLRLGSESMNPRNSDWYKLNHEFRRNSQASIEWRRRFV